MSLSKNNYYSSLKQCLGSLFCWNISPFFIFSDAIQQRGITYTPVVNFTHNSFANFKFGFAVFSNSSPNHNDFIRFWWNFCLSKKIFLPHFYPFLVWSDADYVRKITFFHIIFVSLSAYSIIIFAWRGSKLGSELGTWFLYPCLCGFHSTFEAKFKFNEGYWWCSLYWGLWKVRHFAKLYPNLTQRPGSIFGAFQIMD